MPEIKDINFVTKKKYEFKVIRTPKNNSLGNSPKSTAAEKLPQISPKAKYDTWLRTKKSE